ncbi:hypothetical protein ABE488_00780 [Luteimonas sp. TWI662]|uniref:hypothetical protein n=1 Tax=Luteimonas sp. TWI662 TaxID=3136789 RepID=UPI00320BAB5D
MYAIYNDGTIYGVGATPQEALMDARSYAGPDFCPTGITPYNTDNVYPEGAVADFTFMRGPASADDETAHGECKVRRCEPGLYALVTQGAAVKFRINERGALGLA